MNNRPPWRSIVAVTCLVAPLVAGCFAPPDASACHPARLLTGGIGFLDGIAFDDGGVPLHAGGAADSQATAWTVLAAGLARRAGHEGGFPAGVHVDWLKFHASEMFASTDDAESVVDPASLLRTALQVWGHSPHTVAVADPQFPSVTNLVEAWQARFDPATEAYSDTVSDHLFAGFAAWLFGPADETRAALARHAETMAAEDARWGPDGAFSENTWNAAYARLSVGPQPYNQSLDTHLDQLLSQRQNHDGGVYRWPQQGSSDPATTAAAILAWRVDQVSRTDPRMVAAIDYLCGAHARNGSFPVSASQPDARVVTTAQVVIAVALLESPIPWGHPLPGSGP